MKYDSSKTKWVNEYKLLHKLDKKFGSSSHIRLHELTRIIIQIIEIEKNPDKIFRILDFGCGKSKLIENLIDFFASSSFKFEFIKYDPAVEIYSLRPQGNFDLVINTDVLEHIHQQELDIILKDIRSFSKNCFINISTRLANTILPNGQNAHVTVKPCNWWFNLLKKYWDKELYLYSCSMDEVTICTLRQTIYLRIFYLKKKLRWHYLKIIRFFVEAKSSIRRRLKFIQN